MRPGWHNRAPEPRCRPPCGEGDDGRPAVASSVMLRGFKDFSLRGNVVELSVAFVMAAAFAKVVTATVDLLMDVVGRLGGTPDFSGYHPGGVSIGAWLTAVISFIVLAFVVYFAIVVPYQSARAAMSRGKPASPAAVPEDVALLTEIRDLLRDRSPQP